jgi:hypothetical protein
VKRIPVIAIPLLLAFATSALANPLESVLNTPQVKVTGGSFNLRARLATDNAGSTPNWTCRLYFDTDLNSSTGWFPSRGYEYVACPAPGNSFSLPVSHAQLSSSDGTGGELCGYGSTSMSSKTLTLSVPLSLMGPDDGRLAWELMVFDANGTWIGSYGGRIVQ